MEKLQEWLGDVKQRLMTNMINRTCKNNPSFVDRLAMVLLLRIVGDVPHDPELDHPESS
ncbi:MAG: hypothetical protein ACI9VI_002590 [Candidatus Azotimanducaceae bacterium]|jgi:hypothetical protein